MIKINNKTYTGKSITVINGEVIIDGKKVTPDDKEIHILVEADIDSLQVDSCDEINVTGSVGSVKTMSGDVKVGGSINGNVKTMSGDVLAKEIKGSVSTMSGDITKD